jgi:hypothetical protein
VAAAAHLAFAMPAEKRDAISGEQVYRACLLSIDTLFI